MFNFEIKERTIPHQTFELFSIALEQISQRLEGVILMDDIANPQSMPMAGGWERFKLLLSEDFSALLLAKSANKKTDLGNAIKKNETSKQSEIGSLVSKRLQQIYEGKQDPKQQHKSSQLYEVGLTFDSKIINEFVSTLIVRNGSKDALIELAARGAGANNVNIQSELFLSLLEIFSLSAPENTAASYLAAEPPTPYPSLSICQPVELALQGQIEQERLLNQVTVQIRHSLDLPSILSTAVEQVRQLLQVDRLVIYQFDDSTVAGALMGSVQTPTMGGGRVTYEAKASAAISSVLNWQEGVGCFVDMPNFLEKYSQGNTAAIADVETAYAHHPCFLELMRKAGVRAKLVVPIVVEEQLWGLAIAHESSIRPWLQNEQEFLKHIAEHLAVGIQQALLYAQVQDQKQTLEKRVRDRTQELHDALLAAEAASRAKSEFMGTMSHELRTPLTCVIGMSATLLRWPFGDLSEKQRDYIQAIHDSGAHLLGLINDILDLSQLEAGKTILNMSDFSLSQLARESLADLADKAKNAGVQLETNLYLVPESDRFTADRSRVKQILYNLLSNAIKFTLPGGRATLRIWREERTTVFQVEDTGIGIAGERQSLLFQLFQQLDGSYQRQHGGAGLGLALTKQLVELHGGWIGVNSLLGVGSTFTVHLPAGPLTNTSSASSSNNEETSDSSLGCIVLIESQEDMAIEICDILTAFGYRVVWMIDGATALEQIEVLQPKGAIVDLNLRDMDSYEIIESLHNSPNVPSLKILALTNSSTPEDWESCLEAGADDYLVKPVQAEQLLNQINILTAAATMSSLVNG
ncbi:MAG: GAF domain-containing protein [Oscillatoria sp. SIO1A7]|nr:GAF domain-containing protein [Oscillatoria sp. SIO1A7]